MMSLIILGFLIAVVIADEVVRSYFAKKPQGELPLPTVEEVLNHVFSKDY